MDVEPPIPSLNKLSLSTDTRPSLSAELQDVPPLLRLPVELHQEIATYLLPVEDESILQLRRVNRYFFNTIAAPDHDTLLALEQTEFARTRRLYTCRYCIRLRPKTAFGAAMLRGKRGINGTCRYLRFCVDCGFDTTKSQVYEKGTITIINGERWLWCYWCSKIKKGAEIGQPNCQDSCKACHSYHGCRWPTGTRKHCVEKENCVEKEDCVEKEPPSDE